MCVYMKKRVELGRVGDIEQLLGSFPCLLSTISPGVTFCPLSTEYPLNASRYFPQTNKTVRGRHVEITCSAKCYMMGHREKRTSSGIRIEIQWIFHRVRREAIASIFHNATTFQLEENTSPHACCHSLSSQIRQYLSKSVRTSLPILLGNKE